MKGSLVLPQNFLRVAEARRPVAEVSLHKEGPGRPLCEAVNERACLQWRLPENIGESLKTLELVKP